MNSILESGACAGGAFVFARELGAMEESDEKTAQAKILQILNEHAPLYYAEKV